MFSLTIEFLIIGLLTFGGGSAATPIIHSRLVDEKKWISEDEFIDIVAMANVLPGPSMIQMAAIIGLRRTNYVGSIIAAMMISAPSIIIFVIVMNLFTKYIDPMLMGKITAPIFIVIAVAMAITSIKIFKNNLQESSVIKQIILGGITFSLIVIFNFPTVYIIAIVIVISIVKAVMFNDR